MKGSTLCGGWPSPGRGGVQSSGAALILTLAFIVILTGVVLLFLSHSLLETQVSVASADQSAAALFARGAVDSVVSEFKQEITAGSVATFPPSGSDVRDPNTVFMPTTNQAMVPYRMDAGAPANVLKRSAYNVPFYPSGAYYTTGTWPAPQWAANFSSTNPGTGGRAITMQRWNAPLLMPKADPASTNLTPVSTFIPPDWIYQTRMTGPATTWSPSLIANAVSGTLNGSCVIGRFAYVVYDEGGLLDVNAAGYPSIAIDGSAITPAMMRHKISEACADLTQIGLNPSDINALVAWRNPLNAATSTTYTNYIYSASTNAFLTPAANERLFTSRQQLITFLTQNVANNNPPDVARVQAALTYLTHFSRELNEPSWFPQTNMAASGYNYLTLATNSVASATNAFVPLERANAMYTNVSGLVSNPNQPVAFSRFPLSRLSWIGTSGPTNGATATQVQQSFGLVWDTSANYSAWIYAGPTGSTVQSTILPLNEIHGREPNFFELLKAGILSGSVGVTPGTQNGVPTSSSYLATGGIDSRYYQYDQQVMQIGLAAIDQASPALLPTRIEFAANTGYSALYGNKSLPYVYKYVLSPYRPWSEPPDVVTGGPSPGTYYQAWYNAWEEPVFWNPYQTVVTNTSPLQIRIRINGTNSLNVYDNIASQTAAQGVPTTNSNLYQVGTLPPYAGPTGFDTANNNTSDSALALTCADASTFSSAAANPVLLASILTNTVTPVINDSRANNPWIGNSGNADIFSESNCVYAGLWMGQVHAPNPPDQGYATNAAGTPVPYSQATLYSGQRHGGSTASVQQFVTEANYGSSASPNFLEVQRMTLAFTTLDVFEEYDNFTVVGRRNNFLTVNDPRTGRFSFDMFQLSDYNPSAPAPAVPVTAADQLELISTTFAATTNTASGFLTQPVITSQSATINPSWPANTPPGGTGGFPEDTFRFADNSSTSPSQTSPVYLDTDGAQRQGDGWWSSVQFNALPMREDTIQDRPVFLGRPLYSVGELGYVSRDLPWRSLNFSSTNSPDAGLLDYFCINDGYAGSTNAPVVAGVLDLNTRNPQVLQAMLSGADRAQLYPANDVTATDATNMALKITSLTSQIPLLNKSEIATRLAPNDPTVLPVTSRALAPMETDTNIKERREAIVRALAGAGQVRTWNLMIDLIAQTGHFPPGSTDFNNFVVTAEQRIWAHVAIDRYTGQVVSIQFEPVSE